MKTHALLCLPLVLVCAATSYAGTIASSNFDTTYDLDGWACQGDCTAPAWIGPGGNPGGFLRFTDQASGFTMFAVAPSKFLGSHPDAYGGSLKFDLQQSFNSSPFPDGDVILSGAGLTLYYTMSPGSYPALTPAWSSYDINLVGASFKVGGINGATATDAQLQAVLGALTSMLIRMEYQNGVDLDGLDNVILNANPDYVPPVQGVPEPATGFLVAAAGAGLWLVRRKR